ncbi:MAG: hypothetical protein O2983_14370, partial [Planctomycetota bacterium]|nr:hypothetical protein [Planctomycetota bacterium]
MACCIIEIASNFHRHCFFEKQLPTHQLSKTYVVLIKDNDATRRTSHLMSFQPGPSSRVGIRHEDHRSQLT